MHMTHFKWRAVNLTLTALAKQSHLSLISSTELLLSQPSATSVFLQQPQTGKGIHSLNLIRRHTAKPSQTPLILLHLCLSQNPRPTRNRSNTDMGNRVEPRPPPQNPRYPTDLNSTPTKQNKKHWKMRNPKNQSLKIKLKKKKKKKNPRSNMEVLT